MIELNIDGNPVTISNMDWNKVLEFSDNSVFLSKNQTGQLYPAVRKTIEGKSSVIFLSRLIMNVSDRNDVIAYKDGNTLNLSRKNLRIVSESESKANRPKSLTRKRSSSYLGVSFIKRRGKFQATIKPSKVHKNIFIGYFDTEIEAAKNYNSAAKKHHGKNAVLNPV